MDILGLHITWSWLLSVAIGMLGIGIMILVHELGHMVAARACGINVEILRFGFGPALFRWGKGDTQYIIGAIPFGGLCKMSGQDDLQSAIAQKKRHIDVYEDGSIWSVSPMKRVITYLAGPLSNMLFAFLCYAILMSIPTVMAHSPAKVVLSNDYPALYNVTSTAASEAGIQTGDTILEVNGNQITSYEHMQQVLALYKSEENVSVTTDRGTFTVHPHDGLYGLLPFRDAVVGLVSPDTPEKAAGLKSGDQIISINGSKVTNMIDLIQAAASNTYITMEVLRDGKSVELGFTSPSSTLNFSLVQQTEKIPGSGFFKALVVSGRECFLIFRQSVTSLFNVIRGTASKGETLGGTFAASQSIGMLTTQGFAQNFNSGVRTILFLLASVSISLAVANLLPIPALDGGLILISLAELVTRRTFHPKMYLTMQVVGLVIIVLAIALLTFA